jgi:hypothetical protein
MAIITLLLAGSARPALRSGGELRERPDAFTQFAALTRGAKACPEINYPREGR